MTRFFLVTALTLPLLAGQIFIAADVALAQDNAVDSDNAEAANKAEADKKKDKPNKSRKAKDEKPSAGDTQDSDNENQDSDDGLSFGGDLSELAAELPDFIRIKVRSESNVVLPDGSVEKRAFYEQQTVQPSSEDLTDEQRLGIFVAVLEQQIQKNLVELKTTRDDGEKKKIMDSLKQQFTDRYEFDTAYHDYKASQVESEAAELRKEVEARKKAGDSWVNAMLTLVKAKTDGIETMDMSVFTQADRQTEEPAIASPSDSGTSL